MNFKTSLFDLFGSDVAENYPAAYTLFRRPQETQSPAPVVNRDRQYTGQSPWGDWWNKVQSKAVDWTSDPSNLMKLFAGGLGTYASWKSAKQYNKLAEQQRNALAAREAARNVALAQYNSPINYSYNAGKLQNPMGGDTGEALYFRPDMQVVRAATGGYMGGGTPGQSDKIPALLSDGEFVIDADTVSALGDGNNAAGASALEQMRQNIRKHKRSAPVNKIPPKAKKPEQYLKKGKK